MKTSHLVYRDVERTLAALAPHLAALHDPWWIIAGAAVALHGVDAGEIRDVDLLVSEPDWHILFTLLRPPPGRLPPTDRFRSKLFARWSGPALPVDIMAGFEVASHNAWIAIEPATRVPSGGVFVPDRAELIAMLELFGRPKDRARVDALVALG